MSQTPAQVAKRGPFDLAPEPKSKLGYYRLLSPNCGLRVSPICLGTMNFGNAWKPFMGDIDKKTVFAILDEYYNNGGNFLDTANNYQDEESEAWIGEWLENTKRRDEFVIATKYSCAYKNGSEPGRIQVNYTGNSKKSLFLSVEASLKKLRTSYIDLLYVHFWDYTTPVEEIMQSLNQLVLSGKVHYLGVSDAPAWAVARANQYARDHGLAPFVVYQGKWSIMTRDFERDIIPMCKAEGMGLAPWGVLGGGLFKTDDEIKAENPKEVRAKFGPNSYDNTRAIVKVMEKFAKAKNTKVTSIALAYVFAKVPYVFPVLGGRKVEQLTQNISALENVFLTEEEVKELEAASPIDLGFPHNFIGTRPEDSFVLKTAAKYNWVPEPQPVQHRK